MKFTNGDLLGAINTAFGDVEPGLSNGKESQPVFTQAVDVTTPQVTPVVVVT